MKLKFTKMHGAGNDFIVIDAINQTIAFSPEQWRYLADRRFGIGADQILVVEKAASSDIDFRYRIFNADGGEVEQCGNGSRAFVRFVVDKGLTQKRSIRVQTMSGVIEPSIDAEGLITVNMGVPDCRPSASHFNCEGLPQASQEEDTLWELPLAQGSVQVSSVSMGNPHAVQLVADAKLHPVEVEGPQIERHSRFEKRVNAGFMQVITPRHIQLRVYERGAGETLACGTGACAAVVAGIRRGLLQSPVQVDMRGGRLQIAWQGAGHPVLLSGPAVAVFEGEIEVPDVSAGLS
ncbi:diaminopimelate epimerase [Undibacterium cyanobacteriorum]|uniref:Diaminopimelate epimerase n=1 Tax=Undibacterium cyanobacteriorum TaxID=3073561 RepID=A0ABY9RIE7_9BURK|nr:diaminopimelate epimerase [Undibacterium sp. 20NA77.5]WMW80975.1 diaminopimelate epimerase [Undibacterium sp. 20NA77.5]